MTRPAALALCLILALAVLTPPGAADAADRVRAEGLASIVAGDTGAARAKALLGLPEEPLATLAERDVRPSRAALEEILEGLR